MRIQELITQNKLSMGHLYEPDLAVKPASRWRLQAIKLTGERLTRAGDLIRVGSQPGFM